MNDKKFRAFIIAYVVNFLIIAVSVTLMILAAKAVLPDAFRFIGLGMLLIDVIWFRNFSSQYKK